MSLSTTETSYATHTTRCAQGFDHVDVPVLRLASEVLNATEGFLWVRFKSRNIVLLLLCIFSDIFVDLALRMAPTLRLTAKQDNSASRCTVYVDNPSISVTDRTVFQASNSLQAYKEAEHVVKGLADGTVLAFHSAVCKTVLCSLSSSDNH
jgi:hypothetical protein